jgi:hypothetical protein
MRYTLLLLLLAACGDASGPKVPAATVSIVAGDAQVDTVARTLPVAVVARAAAVGGQPTPQVVVNWYRIAGADTVFAGAALTNAQGEARLVWTLLTKAGTQGLTAWILDDAGVRQTYAQATATATHDRATVVQGARAETVLVAVGAPIFDHDSYSAAYDRFGNWAGPMLWQPETGWRVSADTAWCDVPGLYTMRLALDDVTSHLNVRVQ